MPYQPTMADKFAGNMQAINSGRPAPATLTAYQPTLRDRAANAMFGMMGRGPMAQHVVEGVLGGTGLGHQHTGLADWIPGVGQAFQADEAGRQMGAGHPWAGGANLAMAAIPFPAAAKGLRAIAEEAAPAVRGMFGGAAKAAETAAPIIAYHGSPHTFDAFDASKIGTGEGAQAYGHGLYFAENEGVARGYRDRLADNGGIAYGGKKLTSASIPGPNEVGMQNVLSQIPGESDYAKQKALGDAMFLMEQRGHSPTDAASALQNSPVKSTFPEAYDGVSSWLQQNADLVAARPKNGSMYQVGINAHPDHFLDWDAPLSEQHPVVQQAIEPLLDPMAKAYGQGPLTTQSVGDTFKRLEGKLGAPEMAQQLSDAGIPGIKYLDGGSRGAGEGTSNYVVFNPNTIDILKRYGIAATLGTGALAGAAATPDAQQPAPQPDPTT